MWHQSVLYARLSAVVPGDWAKPTSTDHALDGCTFISAEEARPDDTRMDHEDDHDNWDRVSVHSDDTTEGLEWEEPDGDDPVTQEAKVHTVLKQRNTDGGVEYLVHWEGYPPTEATWETAQSMRGCPTKMEEFLSTKSQVQMEDFSVEIEPLTSKGISPEPSTPTAEDRKSVV